MKKKVVTIAIALVLIGTIFIFYKKAIRGPMIKKPLFCAMSETSVPIPQLLKNKILKLEKDVEIAVGLPREIKEYRNVLTRETIDQEILQPKFPMNSTGGRETIPQSGRTFSVLPKDTELQIESIIGETHPCSFGEGSGPYHYLILRDTGGNLYMMWVAYLGYDSRESFIGLYDKDQRVGSFSYEFVETLLENPTMQHYEPTRPASYAPPTDYEMLKKNCDSECCLRSIQYMQQKKLERFLGTCPDGQHENRLSCTEGASISWCEPLRERVLDEENN